ncbi:MAG TPA: hypothetical protein VN922_19465 [Bacteroidia bacterium]|nr:hypothetical protein [Bacteroidia bacterium]
MSSKQDVKNYHELSKPFESEEQANEKLNAFFDEIYELRKKYKVPDVLITIKADVMGEEGSASSFFSSHSYGAAANALSMAAYTYGVIDKTAKDAIGKLLAGK